MKNSHKNNNKNDKKHTNTTTKNEEGGSGRKKESERVKSMRMSERKREKLVEPIFIAEQYTFNRR